MIATTPSRPVESNAIVPFFSQPPNRHKRPHRTWRHTIAIKAPIAQLAERAAVNRKVVGSIPTWGGLLFLASSPYSFPKEIRALFLAAHSAAWSSGMIPA